MWVAWGAMVLLAGCKPAVVGVAFNTAVVNVEDRAGAPLPVAHGVTADRSQVPLPADAVWTVEPATLADVRGGMVLPRESGQGALVVRANGGRLSGSVPLEVTLVEAVRVRCAWTPCAVRQGQTVRLRGTALSRGVPMAGARLQWQSTNPAVATVDEDGVVTGVTPGPASVQLRAGDMTTSLRVVVVPPPEEIVVICPRPAFSVAFKAPMGMRGTSTACMVDTEQPTRLLGQVRANGQVLPGGEMSWRSGDERLVRVSGGVLTGLKRGSTFVEARQGELSVSIPVNVLEHLAPDELPTQCATEDGPERNFNITTAGNKATMEVTCTGPVGERCFRGLTRRAVDEDTVYVAADRCCCAVMNVGDVEE